MKPQLTEIAGLLAKLKGAVKFRLPQKLLTTSSLLVRPALLGIKVDGIDEATARVALYNSNPVGYVGIFNNEITIAVIPDFQDRGIGLSLLQDMRKSPAFKKEKTYAKVRPENIKSLKAFKKAGFKTKYLHLY